MNPFLEALTFDSKPCSHKTENNLMIMVPYFSYVMVNSSIISIMKLKDTLEHKYKCDKSSSVGAKAILESTLDTPMGLTVCQSAMFLVIFLFTSSFDVMFLCAGKNNLLFLGVCLLRCFEACPSIRKGV